MTEQQQHAPTPGLENLLSEDRRFPPPPGLAEHANATSDLYAWANADRPAFWAEQARQVLTWAKPFTQSLDWSNPPFAT
ncbi:MAG: acetyl-coenzyme A synthetase, partial [Actinobacteria bacterium]|nr:acetyl-coenzyme A synthetase [Actinomycetota bacterium]